MRERCAAATSWNAFFAVGSAFLLSAGCGGRGLETTRVDTLPGGIVRYRNDGPTAWADTNGWRLVRESTIRPEEGSPAAIGNGGMLVVDHAGIIYLLDRGPAVIKRFAPDGRFLGSIGREGGGPGEFHDHGILYLVGDTLVHHDQSEGRLSLFLTDGTFLLSFLTISHIGTDLSADDQGRVPLLIERGTPSGQAQEGVVRYRLDATVVDTLWYPPPRAGREWSVNTARVSAGMAVPFTPERGQILDRRGQLIWGDQERLSLVVSRSGIDTVEVIEAELPATPLSDSVRAATFTETVAKYRWLEGVARLEDLPHSYPVWSELAVDHDGVLWVRRQMGAGVPDRWSVFAAGKWLGDVPAPFPTPTSSWWTKDRVYLLTEGADGVPTIEVWRIVRGTPGQGPARLE